jgi:hypothetical protein
MNHRNLKLYSLTLLLTLGCVGVAHRGDAQKTDTSWKPEIPKTWVDDEIDGLEIPLSDPASSPKHIPSDYYYRIPVRPIYKSYPVYAPGKEPPGYIERLSKQEPEIIFDASKLKTEQDWIKAGELVFDAPIGTGKLGSLAPSSELYLREPKWYEGTRAPVAEDGTLPFYRYVISEKGKVEIGILSCAMCHTRVMPDGSMLKGAQGNFPFDRALAHDYRSADNVEDARTLERLLFTVPGGSSKPENQFGKMSVEDFASAHEAIPAGVLARHRSNPAYDILGMSVGTDSNLTMKTRRGTGYYKVPSLKGVWYRGPFEHSGSVATLEDWFDPRRLRDDYVPTGFKGHGVKTRAVKGHEFGLELSDADRKALIAFLKTL